MSNFSALSWREQVKLWWWWFTLFFLDQHSDQRVHILLLMGTLFQFWANQSLLLFISAACLPKKQEVPILYSSVWPDLCSNPDLQHSRRAGKPLHHRCCSLQYSSYRHLSKVFGNVKKSLYNQPKPYFFKKLLWSHFWIDFNKFYNKPLRIVYILIVYLLIMFICT